MRRLVATALAFAVLAGLVLVSTAGGDDGTSGSYEVRAIFNNGSFIVPGEDVRIAGANVGSVKSVDVSMPGDVVSYRGAPHAVPGKAVVVLDITDSGFKDFRSDASCLIRPQSLIGERFVDCEPTQPRAPGSNPPPLLKQIPDGQDGAGQYLLPLENNGTAVDIDLIQNIQRLPYAERFRLILNELGAGLAARGKDLAEIVRNSNPALRETDRVLAILAGQNRELADLARNSDAVLEPLARQRARLSGFIRSSGETATATAERGRGLALNLQKLPATLREVRLTMRDLGSFSQAALPVFTELNRSAPAINQATVKLSPFSDATTVALKSLGNAAAQSGTKLARSDPIVRKLRGLAVASERPAGNLSALTKSLDKSEGFGALMHFIYNGAGVYNGFDRFGHYQRTNILVTSCIEYQVHPLSGCVANFSGPGTAHPNQRVGDPAAISALLRKQLGSGGGVQAPAAAAQSLPSLSGVGAFGAAPELRQGFDSSISAGRGVLDYLLGP